MRVLAFLLPALAAGAADLNGIWVGQVAARNGAMQDIAFKLEHAGGKLAGKMYGDYHSARIVDGVASGNLVTFVVIAQEQAGNQINETRIRFTGSFKDGALELVREREGSTNAGNAGQVQMRANNRSSITLKRLAGR